MIIVSQDKNEIVNFDNLESIDIAAGIAWEEKVPYKIYYEVTTKRRELGTYATEERAKEVLQEIIRAYVTDRKANDTDNFFGFSMMQKDIYFQMPEN